jgi:hypothetical protein
MTHDAGIAIGPILFIIAVLAILAAAIAAGSGSFTSGTTTESNRTKSSALVQIGDNLKTGFDRIVLEGGLTPSTVDTNVLNTSATNALFSPTGGGIAPPSVGMANIPTSDVWQFVTGPIKGIGTQTVVAGGNDVLAVIRVAPGVCSEINNRTVGNAATPTGADLGNFAAGTSTVAQTVTNWPTSPALGGVGVGCVNNTDGGSSGTYFYQILSVQ